MKMHSRIVARRPATLGYTAIPAAGGGASFGSDAAFRSDFNTIVGPGLLTDSDYNPFLDSATYDITGGTHPAARDDTYTGGVLTAPHGANGSATISPVNLIPGTGKFVVANPSTRSWGVGVELALALTPVSTCEVDLALTSNVDDIVVMRLLGSISTTVFQMIADGTVSGSGKQTTPCNSVATVGSGITVGATIFNRYMLGFNAVTGVLACSVNGVLAASATPGADMPTKAMSPMLIYATVADSVKVHGLWFGWSEST